jgi:hypothetical protein
LSRALKRYYDPLRLPLGRPPLPGASGYRRELLPEPRRFGAEEALSSSHDTPLTVPRPLRRRVPWHPLQAPRCRPWPSPAEWRLGSLLAAVAVFLTTPQASLDAADWSVALRPASTPGSRPTPGPHYRGPWHLPGPDSHRLAAASLSLGYTLVPPSSLRRPSYWTHIPQESRQAAAATGSVINLAEVLRRDGPASQLTLLAGTGPHLGS